MKRVLHISFLFLLVSAFFLWGAATIKYEVFPYLQFRYLAQSIGLLASDDAISPKVAAKIAMFNMFSRSADIVMVGDSITANAEWQDIFKNKRITNRGIGGDTTYRLLNRIDGIISVNPKKAFIMVGINDFYRGLPVEVVFDRYVQIVERLRENGTTVFIQSTLDCSKNGCPREKIVKINKLLKYFSKENDITFIDINKTLSINNSGLDSKYTYDGIHLNAEGYRAWSSIVGKYM